MTNDAKWQELREAEEMAYFRADICCYSPDSYTLEENKKICNDMIATSKATLDAMRKDFEQLWPAVIDRPPVLGLGHEAFRSPLLR